MFWGMAKDVISLDSEEEEEEPSLAQLELLQERDEQMKREIEKEEWKKEGKK